ncbi:MAG: hypothetical protein E7576_07870 [Ruminococcaceae bacterium]|jgi:hypothetical protein|nr:hypothetical protein [Oscillospiraceae bacterium]
MNIRLFNRKYTLRSFGPPTIRNGYAIPSGYTDKTVSIHVHPSGGDQVQDKDGAGEGVARRLEGHGEVEIKISDREAGTKADMLFFDGHWYECVSCEHWFHTILTHYNYRFALVPEHAEGKKSEFNAPMTYGGGL